MSINSDKAHTIVTRGRLVLALLGLALALFGSQAVQPPGEDGDVLVWVNQQPVTLEQLALAEERLTGGSPESLNAMQRQSIIELLIDEELLLQRAENLGTFATDPGVRKAIVQAVIDEVVAEFLAQPVDTRQLKLFYLDHRAVFERPARVAVEALRFSKLSDARQAQAAIVAGTQLTEVARSPNAKLISHLPSSPLPAHMLRRYLGASLAGIALTLEQEETSHPVIRPDGVYLLRATAVLPAEVPEFEDLLADVESEYRVRGRDMALERAIAELWRRAEIAFSPEAEDGIAKAGRYSGGLSRFFEITTQQRGGS